jgi:transcriptional regulator with PAS, ATPase and Fis domain
MALSCVSLPEALLEGELFGHEKGAFTGADNARPGLLESASGGTVFLDEIGEVSPSVQAKLLHVIEERQIFRLGGRQARPIDVRFLSATNRELDADVASGKFRKDLWFRLNAVTIRVPPLRERPDEVESLARNHLATFSERLGVKTPTLSPTARRELEAYAWPGNIRELKNVIERAILLCGGGTVVEPSHLGLSPVRATPVPADPVDDDPERDRILETLSSCGGNQTRAAKALGISRTTLVARIEKYGVRRPKKRAEDDTATRDSREGLPPT